eukprot:GHVT01075616.1.p1 GENE.GHVT01075616.1~~GHVT01075616.1.p1  ORF type:complete len:433 (+),score=81.89 GHVT01075616.1:958-2256(+)
MDRMDSSEPLSTWRPLSRPLLTFPIYSSPDAGKDEKNATEADCSAGASAHQIARQVSISVWRGSKCAVVAQLPRPSEGPPSEALHFYKFSHTFKCPVSFCVFIASHGMSIICLSALARRGGRRGPSVASAGLLLLQYARDARGNFIGVSRAVSLPATNLTAPIPLATETGAILFDIHGRPMLLDVLEAFRIESQGEKLASSGQCSQVSAPCPELKAIGTRSSSPCSSPSAQPSSSSSSSCSASLSCSSSASGDAVAIPSISSSFFGWFGSSLRRLRARWPSGFPPTGQWRSSPPAGAVARLRPAAPHAVRPLVPADFKLPSRPQEAAVDVVGKLLALAGVGGRSAASCWLCVVDFSTSARAMHRPPALLELPAPPQLEGRPPNRAPGSSEDLPLKSEPAQPQWLAAWRPAAALRRNSRQPQVAHVSNALRPT